MRFEDSREKNWTNFYGPNLGYVHELYERYQEDPDSVDKSMKMLFDQLGAPPTFESRESVNDVSAVQGDFLKAASTIKLAELIRSFGHLVADIHPLGKQDKEEDLFKLSSHGLTEKDLMGLPSGIITPHHPGRFNHALEAIEHLKNVYSRSMAFEFDHVNDDRERNWLHQMVETQEVFRPLDEEERKELWHRLMEVTGFEQFLHKTFVGQKRFSIEGLDTLVPMLDEMIREGCHDGVENIMIGMAHRGRLNVLAHVLGKPYELIFSEFHHSPNKDLIPSEGSRGINYGWSGDVKYHLGANRDMTEEDGEEVSTHVTLVNNPSHLEFVSPVVHGFARAAQEDQSNPGYPEQDVHTAFSIVIHGDAAFPGEGIVAETLNLSRLRGYETGGSIHIIANNLLGFTTDSDDSRSTRYASDVAKGFEIPIIHVNADDPEACVAAAQLSFLYRKKFKKDILIDLIGYRKYGHNEMDDPSVTQPLLYEEVNKHSSVATLYAEKLVKEGLIEEKTINEAAVEIEEKLSSIYETVTSKRKGEVEDIQVPKPVAEGLPEIDTKVPLPKLMKINKHLLEWPDEFQPYPKLKRILQRRESAFDEKGKVDWATAEALAFATILHDGKPIRMSGQDVERGTFAHRHSVLHDVKSNEAFIPLHAMEGANASFSIYNSSLSEAAVLGYEYGYSVQSPEALVIWEAQYGDFVNAAQVIIDQFISAGRAKWGQKSSLVMLLPHGYEGQGPEHSSGRLERFLQLSAENNWTVANLTSASQYFHILRRQAAIGAMEESRPLIIMTPKSLLRNPRVASPGKSFSEEVFHPILEQHGVGEKPEKVKRLILCSGKIAIDLEEQLEKMEMDAQWLHIIRVEQIYPFPTNQIEKVLKRYPNLKEITWVQEEPRNMGSWHFIASKLWEMTMGQYDVNYIGRPDRSSPAAGDPNIHKKEQERILNEALHYDHGGDSRG